MIEKDAVSKDFRKQVLGLRTDNSGNRLSPPGSALAAANIRLAGLRYVSEFPGAEGFSSVLGNKARRTAVCGHHRALQTDQACRTTRRGRSLSSALTRGRRGRARLGLRKTATSPSMAANV